MKLSILLLLGLTVGCVLAARPLLHYFQLESYQFPGYFRTLRRNWLKAALPGCCMSLMLAAAILLCFRIMPGTEWVRFTLAAALTAAGGWFTGKNLSVQNAKKKFAFTPRVRRLYATALLVVFLLVLFISGLGNQTMDSPLTIRFCLPLILFPLFLPLWTALSGLIAWPMEKGISEMYFRDAQRILRSRNDLIRIGITGSWGKTSVKFILGTILEEKYRTLVTPASFNTPMGVTKVIRTRLEPGHRVFIAEMGARHVGDIKEMCRLVHPEIGILTSVGPQHLDTFKTLERVAKTKYELIDALPPGGKSFFADDGDLCRQLYEKTTIDKTITGLDPGFDHVWAEHIRYSPEGSTFDLCSGGKRITCHTRLLGELNIRNILLCSAVAFRLGLTQEQVARGIGKIKPIEHRLQLIQNPAGISVIDDAFNSNIRGAQQAFEVLKFFPPKRIAVTPGMVELGDREAELNRKLGQLLAESCDVAVLVGKKRSRAIAEGLAEAGFDPAMIHTVSSLDEATALLGQLTGKGDTVLFENDLPDNYTE